MNNSMKTQNDALMKTGYEILQECKENGINCFIWGGGAVYHLLGGKLDYRVMSDIEFLLPKSHDNKLQSILEEIGFIPYSTFNNMQNMYALPRREFYKPNRELTEAEISDVKHGRKKDLKDVEFQKVELFIDGIRMCWSFKIDELPKNYKDSLICPAGFQLALKGNPIHPDDFDLKDIQDIANILGNSNCNINQTDTIFTEASLLENMNYNIGREIFLNLSKSKYQFSTTVLRNFIEVLNYSGLTENGKNKLNDLIEFLTPIKEKEDNSRFASLRKERPCRVDSRTR